MKKCSGIGGEFLEAFQNHVASCCQTNIPFEPKEHNFTEVLNRLKKQNDKEKIILHTSRRVRFRHSSDSPLKHAARSAVENVIILEKCVLFKMK